MTTVEDVVGFWLDNVGQHRWYAGDDALDAEVRARFEQTWWDTRLRGANGLWLTYPTGALAYIILMDQFPRNMFRGTARAFSSDNVALAAAKAAISNGWDLRIDEPARQFFYLPLMHSESLTDQERAVRLIKTRMSEGEQGNLLHARAHREEIRKFGRFPGRNVALDRKPTGPEIAYQAGGGYGELLRRLS